MIKMIFGASETKTVTAFKREANDSDLSSFRVQSYSSFEYRVQWETSMYPERSSRRQKTSEIRPPESPPEEVIRRRTRGRTRRHGGVDADEDGAHDLLDLIRTAEVPRRVPEGDDEEDVVIIDTGLDSSDEDCPSNSSRLISGPSPKRWASQHPCAACLKLYQRAKRARIPIKDKLLDNDPKSLTCDQWVLLKRWTPRRVATGRGKLLCQLKFSEQVTEEEMPSCSRPHPFLHRNLRRVRMSAIQRKGKKNKMKRPRADSLESRAAKLLRLQPGNDRQRVSIGSVEDSPGSSSSCQETDDRAELIPSPVTLKTTEPRQTLFEQNLPGHKRGFRELLAQLRGSTIVREIQ